MPVSDQFWGDRYGTVEDPFGNVWGLATHIEDVDPKEMKKRGAKMMKDMAKAQQA
jgi:PhnB protein